MTLKWSAVLVATVSLTLCVTGNAVTLTVNGGQLPLLVNLFALTTAGTSIIVAVVAELHDRLDNRLCALTEFLVERLREIEAHTGDRNAGFVEGYLLNRAQDAAVVPFGRRGRGAAER
ncbi:hypothetical protein [Micromonospora endophytica]|uniref:Uncharacterized protein n=1 Tax=Micromonospora endophytica TaxID=515350 RepID=A0A2W2BVF8_9ACTN|nr:hypothetical protein [Micromonospora endophytica]PZF91271.1 hypothetical protein C1I93_21740 [Micromonospora endophytica]RIW45438.1 hypothetical protein D3H59_15250 [Micromonospora endophytica]BCJ58575.1 hypothetical protein Jiend_19970 [Micromonospora endophytica]